MTIPALLPVTLFRHGTHPETFTLIVRNVHVSIGHADQVAATYCKTAAHALRNALVSMDCLPLLTRPSMNLPTPTPKEQ